MPFIDFQAANTVRDLREDAGYSQEGLSRAIRDKAQSDGWYKVHGAVDAFTIRAIEKHGHCPSQRVRVAIALFFGVSHRDIWQPGNQRADATPIRDKMRGAPAVAT
jgi:hypothetical protein